MKRSLCGARAVAPSRSRFGRIALALFGIATPLAGAVPAFPGQTNETAPPPLGRATPHLTNSLGLRFVSVPGTSTWFSIWETRVQDYEAFRAATGRSWNPPAFHQGPTHPVVNVSWEDADAFCRWLTSRERQDGRLTAKQRYRLPTDQEWNLAVGLGPEQGRTPEDRMKGLRVWPWGSYWPPMPGDGNYGAELAVDSFAGTAPAGSFPAGARGLHDLGGNVWEWCEDWFNEAHVTRVLRGGSFNDAHPAYLLAGYRFHGTMNLSNEDFGFRVVIENPD